MKYIIVGVLIVIAGIVIPHFLQLLLLPIIGVWVLAVELVLSFIIGGIGGYFIGKGAFLMRSGRI